MRCSKSCQNSTRCAPTKLVASTPVRKMTSMVRIAPSPGIWTPSQCSVWNDSGTSSSDASSVSKMTFSTHSVMINGIQISSPVIRYFLNAPEMKCFFTASANEKARTRAGPVRSRKVDAAAQAAALDSVLVSGFASGLDSVLLSVLVSALVSAFLSADFFAAPLKSVAYQPVPLSWKPAAESCLRYSGLPQAGHTESGASDTFCRCSSWCPQIAQRYS